MDVAADFFPPCAPVASSYPVGATDLIVSHLTQLGVEYVFGIPGGAIEPMYDALGRSELRGGPRPIVARHESGAVFMADGYSRETGKLGVCIATTGPGTTNLITGVATAYQDNVPLLVITAQTALPTFGRGALQESACTSIDTVSMFAHCTRYNTLVSHSSQLERKLATAIMVANQSPRGPVHLSIPLDVQRMQVITETPPFRLRSLTRDAALVDIAACDEVARRLAFAVHPVIIAGEMCNDDAAEPVLRLAEHLGAYIVTTPRAKGLINPRHPLYRGVFGLAGHQSAHEALAHPLIDLIVIVGSGLDEISSRGWDDRIFKSDHLIHIDSNPGHLTYTPMAQQHVRGHIRTTLETVLQKLGAPDRKEASLLRRSGPEVSFRARARALETPDADAPGFADPMAEATRTLYQTMTREPGKCFSASIPLKPQWLMYELSTRFPPDTRFLVDIGNSILWATHYLFPPVGQGGAANGKSRGAIRNCMGYATMGWSIGGAIGTALGAKGAPVVSIVGDGSILMSGQELTVAVSEGLPVIYVILNDASLGTVKHGQRLAGAERVGYQLPQVDYYKIARILGATGYLIETPEDLAACNIASICRQRGPTVLDIRIDPEEVPPLGSRMESLGTGVDA